MSTVAVVVLDIHKKLSKAVALDRASEVLEEWRIEPGVEAFRTAVGLPSSSRCVGTSAGTLGPS